MSKPTNNELSCLIAYLLINEEAKKIVESEVIEYEKQRDTLKNIESTTVVTDT